MTILNIIKTGVAAVLLMAAVTASGTAAGFGDPLAGRDIARTWCAECHVVDSDQTSASADAPPFTEIKRSYQGRMDFLEAFLAQTHPQMPDMNLTYREIRDLVAYFESL